MVPPLKRGEIRSSNPDHKKNKKKKRYNVKQNKLIKSTHRPYRPKASAKHTLAN